MNKISLEENKTKVAKILQFITTTRKNVQIVNKSGIWKTQNKPVVTHYRNKREIKQS